MLFPESFEWETSEIVNGGRRGSFLQWFRKVAYDKNILIYIMLVLYNFDQFVSHASQRGQKIRFGKSGQGDELIEIVQYCAGEM